MRVHFRNVHNNNSLIVEEEGPLPRCERCGLFQLEVGPKHQQSGGCVLWTASRKKRADNKVNQKAVRDTVFNIQGAPIGKVTEFKYLGWVVNNKDDDRQTVIENLRKARIKWGRISRILSKDGADPKAMSSFYKAIEQSVLLYGSELWVLTLAMEKQLCTIH
jgi:hypothetical protein